MFTGIRDAQWSHTLSREILNWWDYMPRFSKAFEEEQSIYRDQHK